MRFEISKGGRPSSDDQVPERSLMNREDEK